MPEHDTPQDRDDRRSGAQSPKRRRVSSSSAVPVVSRVPMKLPGHNMTTFVDPQHLPDEQRLKMDIIRRNEYMRILRECMGKGVYNSVILPEEGMLTDDDLFDRVLILPGGVQVTEKAGPADLNDAQREKLFLQCFTVKELLRALNRRDEANLLYLQEQREQPARRGRTAGPSQPKVMDLIEEVLHDLHLENPAAETMRIW